MRTFLILTLLLLCPLVGCGNELESRHLVFKIQRFDKIVHSEKKSHSFVSGTTIAGRKFEIKVVWEHLSNGPKYLDEYKKMQSKSIYTSGKQCFILAGMADYEGKSISLTPDTITPKGIGFKADPKDIY